MCKIPKLIFCPPSSSYRSDEEPWLIPVDLVEADLKSVVQAARPLVAIRTKNTQDTWYTDYPMLVAYTDIDTTKDGAEGIGNVVII